MFFVTQSEVLSLLELFTQLPEVSKRPHGHLAPREPLVEETKVALDFGVLIDDEVLVRDWLKVSRTNELELAPLGKRI